MKIVEGDRVDLISPFPAQHTELLAKWLFLCRSNVETDLSPHTVEEYEALIRETSPRMLTFGVIDRNGELGLPHEAPLIGHIAFEPHTCWNTYVHVASPRRAWGKGLIDEGMKLAFKAVFAQEPSLQRISAVVARSNHLAHGLAKRLGMVYEGTMKDMIVREGVPRALVHYGMTRRMFEAPQTEAPVEPSVATTASTI